MKDPDSAKDANALGLVFEPDSYRIHFYQENEAIEFTGSSLLEFDHGEPSAERKGMNPLYALANNPHWTLVPKAVFREEDAKRYLRLNTGYNPDNECGFTEISRVEAVMIFEKTKGAEAVAKQIHPALSVKPLARALLNYADRISDEWATDFLLIYSTRKISTVIGYRRKKLLIANSLQTDHIEDLEYYLFYLLKKLDLPLSLSVFMAHEDRIETSERPELKRRLKNIAKPPLLEGMPKGNTLTDLIPLIAPRCA
jgi:hypothetical protein